MKAQRSFGLDLSWSRLTVVFLIDVAVLALASHWPGGSQAATYAWWTGVGIAAVVTLAALVTYRRTPLTSALAARVLDRFVDPKTTLATGRTPAIDHRRRFSRDTVGMREHDGQLVSVVTVEGLPERRSGRHHQPAASPSTLPVATVAAGLRQFDVRLDAIDVVSVTAVPNDNHDPADNGEPAEEDAPAEHRGTWLVLRMNPQHNTAAVAARDSLASTLAAVTERLAQDVDGSRCAARPLTAAEISDVDAAVLAGLEPDHIRASRRRLKQKQPAGPKEYVTSFWVSPWDITTQTLDQLWLSGVDAMAVTIRLVPRRGGTEVSAWVRYHSGERLSKGVWAGLNRLTGRQLAAVCASLPEPAVRLPLSVPARELGDEELEVPVGTAPHYPRQQVGTSP
jgi:type VII secretion protein EccE